MVITNANVNEYVESIFSSYAKITGNSLNGISIEDMLSVRMQAVAEIKSGFSVENCITNMNIPKPADNINPKNAINKQLPVKSKELFQVKTAEDDSDSSDIESENILDDMAILRNINDGWNDVPN